MLSLNKVLTILNFINRNTVSKLSLRFQKLVTPTRNWKLYIITRFSCKLLHSIDNEIYYLLSSDEFFKGIIHVTRATQFDKMEDDVTGKSMSRGHVSRCDLNSGDAAANARVYLAFSRRFGFDPRACRATLCYTPRNTPCNFTSARMIERNPRFSNSSVSLFLFFFQRRKERLYLYNIFFSKIVSVRNGIKIFLFSDSTINIHFIASPRSKNIEKYCCKSCIFDLFILDDSIRKSDL